MEGGTAMFVANYQTFYYLRQFRMYYYNTSINDMWLKLNIIMLLPSRACPNNLSPHALIIMFLPNYLSSYAQFDEWQFCNECKFWLNSSVCTCNS